MSCLATSISITGQQMSANARWSTKIQFVSRPKNQKKTVPTYVKPMAAQSIEKLPEGGIWIYELNSMDHPTS